MNIANRIHKHSTARIVVGTVLFVGAFVFFWMMNGASRVSASANVSGTVKSPSLVGVAGITVCFHGPSGECPTTGPGGTYMTSLQPGRYHVSTKSATGVDYGPAPEQDYDVIDGQWQTLDLTLTALQMKGNLKKADGSAVQGWVNVHTSDWSQNKHSDSDQNGFYTVGGLSAGEYIAETGLFNNVSGVVAPEPKSVSIGGSPQVVDFVYAVASKTLTGTIIKNNGAVATDACVDANKLNTGTRASTHVDGAGNYLLSLSGGSWLVNTNPCTPAPDWIAGNAIQVDFANDTTVESRSLNFTVTIASSSVSGTVRDKSGNLITTGNVDVRNSSGMGSNGQVQSNGTYRVNLVPGTYDVRFWSPSNAYNLPPTTVTVGDGQALTLDLVLTAKTAHIKGCVRTRAGLPATNVPVNAWQQTGPGGGPGGWGNARTAADCTYDMLVTAGQYGMNVSMEPNSAYVPVGGPQVNVTVPTDSSVVTDINFTVDVADATITGSVTLNGSPLPNMNGCVYARPAGSFNENCSPMDPRNGTFTIRVSSAVSTSYQVGCHTPPNAPYSCGSPVTVNITSGANITQNVELLSNNSTVGGRLFDSSGFPVGAAVCEKLKGAMVFADREGAHYQGQINSDCSYRISLVAGVYNIGAFFPPESGAMNSPPGSPIQVFSGQTVEKNIQFTQADASVTVRLLDQNGNGTQGYVNLDNSDEINQSRQGGPGQGDTGKGADLGFNKKTPCNAKDPAGVLKCCGVSKNKNVCKAFAIPDGPNKCKNAWDCAQYCKKNKKVCEDSFKQNQNSGPQPGQGTFVAGPGGCSSPEECQKYCSDPAHQTECAKQAPPPSAQSTTVRISSKASVKVTAVAGKEDQGGANFDKIIRSGSPTDFQGNARILTLSGHKYKVCAGLPPQSNAMPPKCQFIDLTTAKTANVTLQLRDADATISGKVAFEGVAQDRCFVHAWAEDGNFSGQGCNPDGTYKVNVTCNTKWHIGADSMKDVTFYRSDEVVKVIECGTKTYSQNLDLKKQDFEVPHPVSVNGACSSTLSLGLSNGAKIEVPGGALSSSTDGICSCTASPTIELVATQANQPEGVGYTIECRDENNAVVKKLNTNAVITLPYKIPKNREGTSYESALQAVFYDSTLGAYKNLDTCTKNTENNTFSCPVDHFSVYTIANSSGSSANGALATVTVSRSKTNITSFTVGGKKVTPFAKCKDTVNVVTNAVSGKQYIAAVSSCEGSVKVYDVKGKLLKTIKTGWKGINTVAFSDVTKDGNADILLTSTSGTEVRVIEIAKKYKATNIGVGKRAARLTVAAVDFTSNGIPQVVAATVTNNKAQGFQVYKFNKGKFQQYSTSYAQYLKDSGGSIVLDIPTPQITSISGTVKATATKATIKVKGKNFTSNSGILIGSVGATKITFKSSTELSVVFDATKLGAGKFAVTVTNPGGKVSKSKTLTIK
ncbi:MAG: carboxypeptidase regulatory-like domain-containing protein [Candidatus Kerfeldbacteria bacterium]